MIVGIGHTARAGKDTAAQALCRDLGYTRVSFADKLKRLAFLSDPMILANQMTNVGVGSGHLMKIVTSVGGWEQAKDRFPEVRRYLQNLGVAARDVFGDEVWIDAAFANYLPGDKLVVADVRFPNEAEAIKARGGKVIKIARPGFEGGTHISETALADYPFDAVVENTGSIVELEAKIVELVKGWLKQEAGLGEERVER